MGVFLTQGLVIGWLGVALGVALGLALALNVDTHRALPRAHLRLPDLQIPDVYYITTIPSDVQLEQRGGDQRLRRCC